MFLWVTLAVRQAEEQRHGLTPEKLKKLTCGLPTGLTALYNQIMDESTTNVRTTLTLLRLYGEF